MQSRKRQCSDQTGLLPVLSILALFSTYLLLHLRQRFPYSITDKLIWEGKQTWKSSSEMHRTGTRNGRCCRASCCLSCSSSTWQDARHVGLSATAVIWKHLLFPQRLEERIKLHPMTLHGWACSFLALTYDAKSASISPHFQESAVVYTVACSFGARMESALSTWWQSVPMDGRRVELLLHLDVMRSVQIVPESWFHLFSVIEHGSIWSSPKQETETFMLIF